MKQLMIHINHLNTVSTRKLFFRQLAKICEANLDVIFVIATLDLSSVKEDMQMYTTFIYQGNVTLLEQKLSLQSLNEEITKLQENHCFDHTLRYIEANLGFPGDTNISKLTTHHSSTILTNHNFLFTETTSLIDTALLQAQVMHFQADAALLTRDVCNHMQKTLDTQKTIDQIEDTSLIKANGAQKNIDLQPPVEMPSLDNLTILDTLDTPIEATLSLEENQSPFHSVGASLDNLTIIGDYSERGTPLSHALASDEDLLTLENMNQSTVGSIDTRPAERLNKANSSKRFMGMFPLPRTGIHPVGGQQMSPQSGIEKKTF